MVSYSLLVLPYIYLVVEPTLSLDYQTPQLREAMCSFRVSCVVRREVQVLKKSVKHLALDTADYEDVREAHDWERLFNSTSCTPPAGARAVLQSSKAYAPKTPLSSRASIAAWMGLVDLRAVGKLKFADSAWLSVAVLPRTILHYRAQYWMVLATAMYCLAVMPLKRIERGEDKACLSSGILQFECEACRAQA